MRYLIPILIALSASCTAPEPDRCLDGQTLLMGGAAYACPGPRGCYEVPGGLACDDSVVRPGAPCAEDGQLWCAPGWLYRCESGAWTGHEPCHGGCYTAPVRCLPEMPPKFGQ